VTDHARAPAFLREHGQAAATGLRLRDGISFNDWLGLGSQISRISSASDWWLGDWLLYGRRTYSDRYKQAIQATKLEYQTLRNYAWVARRFPMSRRRDTVSFQHHAEVAARSEAEQDVWLERAERLRWSRNELRRQLAAGGPRRQPSARARAVVLHLPVTEEREQRWQKAASASEQGFVDWMVFALDVTADNVLATDSPRYSRDRGLALSPAPVVRLELEK
jgi:hypothetical protein